MSQFRIITANFCSDDQPRRLQAITEALAEQEPDILVAQEVVDPKRTTAELANLLGPYSMRVYFNNNRKQPEKNEHLLVTTFGHRVTPVQAEIVARPNLFAGSRHLGRICILQPRTTGRIDVQFAQGFTLNAIHHDWADGSTLWHTTHRKRQMHQLLGDLSGRTLIAGDFNNGIGSPSIEKLRDDPRVCGRATSIPTWPAEPYNFWQDNLLGFWSAVARWPERKWGTVLPNGELPRANIDNIYHTPGLVCVSSGVFHIPGSDHLGVVADYELE